MHTFNIARINLVQIEKAKRPSKAVIKPKEVKNTAQTTVPEVAKTPPKESRPDPEPSTIGQNLLDIMSNAAVILKTICNTSSESHFTLSDESVSAKRAQNDDDEEMLWFMQQSDHHHDFHHSNHDNVSFELDGSHSDDR